MSARSDLITDFSQAFVKYLTSEYKFWMMTNSDALEVANYISKNYGVFAGNIVDIPTLAYGLASHLDWDLNYVHEVEMAVGNNIYILRGDRTLRSTEDSTCGYRGYSFAQIDKLIDAAESFKKDN